MLFYSYFSYHINIVASGHKKMAMCGWTIQANPSLKGMQYIFKSIRKIDRINIDILMNKVPLNSVK